MPKGKKEKFMKKLLTLLLALTLSIGVFASCGGNDGKQSESASETGDNTPQLIVKTNDVSVSAPVDTTGVDYSNVKIGLITLHGESSTYDKNFIDSMKDAANELGFEYVIVTDVPETNACAEAARDLVDQGCNIIFADSFGHEPFMIDVAEQKTEVEFCHATGTYAHTEGIENYHNAFASIYEGRYVAGVVAGMKLAEMYKNNELKDSNFDADGNVKVGYIGAYTYAEVVSGYTSWFLGVRNTFEELVEGKSVSMEVQFTGSWYDEDAEKNAANTLIGRGAALISQHADSMGAPSACETARVPNVSYNGSTIAACPNTFLVSSRINWAPYFKYIATCVAKGEKIATDWSGTIANGAVVLTALNENVVAEGTAAKVEEVLAKLNNKELKVFSTATFKVGGKVLTSYGADVDSDAAYVHETEAISDGYFHESQYRSAPYFDINIDGITLLNTAF